MAEGKAAAEEALKMADEVLLEGLDIAHPVRALALTYLGFFYKANNEHERAVVTNLKAMKIRREVYGE